MSVNIPQNCHNSLNIDLKKIISQISSRGNSEVSNYQTAWKLIIPTKKFSSQIKNCNFFEVMIHPH